MTHANTPMQALRPTRVGAACMRLAFIALGMDRRFAGDSR
jgi:hypothetical protein